MNAVDNQGNTPLYLARTHDVPKFLEMGAEPNYKYHKGETHYSTGNVRALVAAGADIEVKDNMGQTLLLRIVRKGYDLQSKVKELVKLNLGKKPILFTAINRQDVDTVRTLLEAGVDCNSPFRPIDDSLSDEPWESKKERITWQEREEREWLSRRPIHYAANPKHNPVEDRGKAVAVVQLPRGLRKDEVATTTFYFEA